MKLRLSRHTKLNTAGVAHIIVPLLAIVAIGSIGSILLTASHADTLTYPLAYVKDNSADAVPKLLLKTVNATTKATQTVDQTSAQKTSVIPAAYSPDHTYLAWGYESAGQPILVIQNIQTKVKKLVSLPSGETFSNSLAWFPANNMLALTTDSSSDSYLRTVHADGTGLGTLVSSPSPFVSFAPSGDGHSVLYSISDFDPAGTLSNVYSVTAGAAPVIVKAGTCYNLRTFTDQSANVAYTCSTFSNGSYLTAVYSSAPGSLNAKRLYTFHDAGSDTAGNVGHGITDIAPSPDGRTLALLTTKTVVVDPDACTSTQQVQISTIPLTGGTLKVVYSGNIAHPTATQGGCRGAYGGDLHSLAWSPDETTLAYLKGTPFDFLDTKGTNVSLITISTGKTRQLVAAKAYGLSW